MKKVPRLRVVQDNFVNMVGTGISTGATEQVGVRTTGRIKKPKAVFDPSDNYLSRAQRANIAAVSAATERKKDSPVTLQASRIVEKRESQSSATSYATSTTATTATTSYSDVVMDVCVVCLKKEAKRGSTAKNKLISCLECDKKIHKLCLKVDFEDLDILRQNYKCENCRTCELCDAFADFDVKADRELVTCAKCVRSYHLTCHIPNVLKFQQFQRNWKCNKCTLPTIGNGNTLPVKAIREIIGDEPKIVKTQQTQQTNVNIAAAAAEAKTAAAAVKRSLQENAKTNSKIPSNAAVTQQPPDEAKKLKRDQVNSVSGGGAGTSVSTELPESSVANSHASGIRYSPDETIDVPDVKYWSVDQVAEYFAKYFPNEAHVFKEHEIDGMSLLLLKRSDIMKKLPIKLGPSLRIYSLILKIQTQLNDATLGWNCGL